MDDEVEVVRHQAIRVDRAMPQSRGIAKQRQIDDPVGIVMKAILPVVAPLHDVQRDIRHDQPSMSPHARRTAERRWPLTK